MPILTSPATLLVLFWRKLNLSIESILLNSQRTFHYIWAIKGSLESIKGWTAYPQQWVHRGHHLSWTTAHQFLWLRTRSVGCSFCSQVWTILEQEAVPQWLLADLCPVKLGISTSIEFEFPNSVLVERPSDVMADNVCGSNLAHWDLSLLEDNPRDNVLYQAWCSTLQPIVASWSLTEEVRPLKPLTACCKRCSNDATFSNIVWWALARNSLLGLEFDANLQPSRYVGVPLKHMAEFPSDGFGIAHNVQDYNGFDGHLLVTLSTVGFSLDPVIRNNWRFLEANSTVQFFSLCEASASLPYIPKRFQLDKGSIGLGFQTRNSKPHTLSENSGNRLPNSMKGAVAAARALAPMLFDDLFMYDKPRYISNLGNDDIAHLVAPRDNHSIVVGETGDWYFGVETLEHTLCLNLILKNQGIALARLPPGEWWGQLGTFHCRRVNTSFYALRQDIHSIKIPGGSVVTSHPHQTGSTVWWDFLSSINESTLSLWVNTPIMRDQAKLCSCSFRGVNHDSSVLTWIEYPSLRARFGKAAKRISAWLELNHRMVGVKLANINEAATLIKLESGTLVPCLLVLKSAKGDLTLYSCILFGEGCTFIPSLNAGHKTRPDQWRIKVFETLSGKFKVTYNVQRVKLTA